MTKTLAVIGAGPGIGMAVARRFGREGYRVALIARSEARLARHVAQLAAAEVEAAAFPADVLQRPQLAEALARAADRFGPIDAIEYNPAPAPSTLSTPREIRADGAQYHFDHAVLGAITAVREVLPGMLARGDGALLFCSAASALFPVPFSSNFAIAAAGLRSYATSLHHDLAPQGIYAGILLIAGLVDASDPRDPSAPESGRRASPLPLVPAAGVANRFWELLEKRDQSEAVLGDLGVLQRLWEARASKSG